VQLPRISTDFDTVGSRDTKPLKSHFEERGNKPQLPPIESSPFSPEVVIPKSLRIQRNESAPVEPQFSGDMSDSDYDVETDPLNVDHADCNQSYSDDVLPTESSVELQSAEISGLLDTYLEEITEDLERGNMSRELVDYLRRRSLTPDSDEDEEEDDQIGELYVRNGGKLGRTSLSVVRRALRD
jgi:hypothetical protein